MPCQQGLGLPEPWRYVLVGVMLMQATQEKNRRNQRKYRERQKVSACPYFEHLFCHVSYSGVLLVALPTHLVLLVYSTEVVNVI